MTEQNKELVKSIKCTTRCNIGEIMLEMDKMFLDKPELRKNIYSNKIPTKKFTKKN